MELQPLKPTVNHRPSLKADITYASVTPKLFEGLILNRIYDEIEAAIPIWNKLD